MRKSKKRVWATTKRIKALERGLPFGFGRSNREVVNGHKTIDKAEMDTKMLAINKNFVADCIVKSCMGLGIFFNECGYSRIGNDLMGMFDRSEVIR